MTKEGKEKIKKELVKKLYKKVQNDRWLTKNWCEDFIKEIINKLTKKEKSK